MTTPLNWKGKPPKEFVLFEGCDYQHWLIVMDAPVGQVSREDLIAKYVQTLAIVMGSNEEAKKAIYSVSTRHYFAFGCKIPEELSEKLKPLPGVRFVLPDSYLDPRTKSYGGEPFINGEAVPYDEKYHAHFNKRNH